MHMRNVFFIATHDIRHQLRQGSTLLWLFVMPPIFFYFIGTVTGGFSGAMTGGSATPLVIAAEAPGFLREQIDLRLRDNAFEPEWREEVLPDENGELPRRVLTLDANLSDQVVAGETVKASFDTRASALSRDFEVIRIQRSLYTALADIVTEFGPEYLATDGTLDRGKLRQLVFAEPASRHRLEAILHPLIRNNIIKLVNTATAPYCIVSIPLLLETGQTDLVDRILVIDIPEALQLSRTAARDRVAMDEIRPVLETQADRSMRLAAADDVISNAGSLDELAANVQALHQKYLSLSARI